MNLLPGSPLGQEGQSTLLRAGNDARWLIVFRRGQGSLGITSPRRRRGRSFALVAELLDAVDSCDDAVAA